VTISLKADTSELDRIPELIEGMIKGTHDRAANRAQQLAETIEARVRADIAGAGNFGARWTEGFKVTVTADDPNSVTVTGKMGDSVPYWQVFQYGATIRGKPFLWFKPKEGTVTGKKGFSLGKTPSVIKVRQVVIHKRFHIIEIIEEEVRKAGATLTAATVE
jgi:hypothetical protein